MIVRRVMSISVLSGTCVLAACAQLGQATAANPVAAGSVYRYTAVGASDAVGFGSSAPCPTGAVVIGSDTEQMPMPVNCPGGHGYIPLIARRLTTGINSMTLTDLGISGAVIGPTERALGNEWEPLLFQNCSSSGPNVCIPGDFIDDELPIIPSSQNVVTIFAGGNDTDAILAHVAVACGSCTPTQIKTMITDDVTNFGLDYQTLLDSVHASYPFARIYVANLPNFGLTPRGVCIGSSPSDPPPFCGPNDPALGQPGLEALLDAISTGIDAGVINSLIAAKGIPVIDAECDPQSYDPKNFYVDGFHPDDSGYSLLAQKFALTIRNFGGPLPAGSCGIYSQSGVRPAPVGARRAKLPYVRY